MFALNVTLPTFFFIAAILLTAAAIYQSPRNLLGWAVGALLCALAIR